MNASSFHLHASRVDLIGVEPITPILQGSVATIGMQAPVRLGNVECRNSNDQGERSRHVALKFRFGIRTSGFFRHLTFDIPIAGPGIEPGAPAL
jgi:hypothetical protein